MKQKIKIIYVPTETGRQYVIASYFRHHLFWGSWELMILPNGELVRFSERELIEHLEIISTQSPIILSFARYNSIDHMCDALGIQIV